MRLPVGSAVWSAETDSSHSQSSLTESSSCLSALSGLPSPEKGAVPPPAVVVVSLALVRLESVRASPGRARRRSSSSVYDGVPCAMRMPRAAIVAVDVALMSRPARTPTKAAEPSC